MTRSRTKTEVLEQLARMEFKPSTRDKVHELANCLDESGRVSLSTLHEQLFSGRAVSTVYDNVVARVGWINSEAERVHSPLRLQLTPQDSDQERWVQVEWTSVPPPEALAQDLARAGHRIPLPASSDLTQFADIDARPIVLVVCNDYEATAVEHFFDPSNESTEGHINGRPYTFLATVGEEDRPSSMQAPIVMMRSGTGLLAAARSVESACEDWKPQLVIGVGIAYGVNESKHPLGTVVVSEAVVESAESIRPETVSPREAPFRVPDEVFLKMRRRNQQGQEQQNPWPQVEFGTFLSASQKISKTAYRNSKLEPYAGFGIIAGDMEAAAIASVCNRRQVPWLVVKAVSDFATEDEIDPSTKDKYQAEAALRSARVVYAFLAQDFPVEPFGWLPGPHGEDKEGYEESDASGAPSGEDDWPMARLADVNRLPEEKRLIVRAGSRELATKLFSDGDSSRTSNDYSNPSPEESKETVDILSDLDSWIRDSAGKPLFAIFGDFGSGKTIACQAFTRNQQATCQANRKAPWPLYFDLRKVQLSDGQAPTLTETMLQCAHRGWKRAESVTSRDLWGWINRGAVVIFDGLDEVLTKLDEDAGQLYTDDLLSVLNQADVPIRVLISSRSQFFRNLEEERTRLTGAERSDKDGSWYEARWLLPLTKKQIRHYFEISLPAMDVDQIMKMVSEVHNLSDLSRRPYTLSLVADAIPEIAQRRDKGLLVNGSTIYRKFVRKWLRRDDLKHHIKLEHKLYLVEELAAQLWATGRTEIPIEELEEWFDTWRQKRKGWKRYRKVTPDKLEEDLRNSTFLSRVDVTETQGAFRFAHTSLQEFFLSEYMLRALEENVPERWAIRPPSSETYGFLGMSLAEKDESTRQGLLTTMGSWFTGTDVQINTAILRYRMEAGYGGLPQVTLPLIRPQIEPVPVDEARQLLKTMRDGDHVSVGGYSWTLLNKDRKTALLLCDQIVDYQPYNTEYAQVNWETCTLRTWLNNDFLSSLPKDFQSALVDVDASGKRVRVAVGATNTDKLFLLSSEEEEDLLPKKDTRIAYRHDGDAWWWWLRSVGAPRDRAPIVLDDGRVRPNADTVHNAYGGVRPALKMNL
ncbi:MAG: DUF6273 domain-containing protein [Propionibacteriaceae bacterium]|jgi:nucleoside phosphorylase|nr:DUF6273 domain-containing protein [Propionibacteriaceae bacterium]